MASILPLGPRPTPLAPPGAPPPAQDAADAATLRGRQALLAHDDGAARAAFDELSRHPEPRRAHDGRVGLAMLTLGTLAPEATAGARPEAPPPYPRPEGCAEAEAGGPDMRGAVPADVDAAPPALAADARFAAAIATLTSRPFAVPSELACLGAARAALQLGRPDEAWRALARVADSPEALLGRAASQHGLGASARAREILWPAVRPWTCGPRLGVASLAGLPTAVANVPEASRAALHAAYVELDAAVADNDPVYGAKDLARHLRRHAPHSFEAAVLDVTDAAGDARRPAWEALCDRWPRSVEAVTLGVRYGLVAAEARAALVRGRPRDAVLQNAVLLGALGAENWVEAIGAAEALWQARPTAELGGLLVRLGSLARQDAAWMRAHVARTLPLNDAEPLSIWREARGSIAAGRVDDGVVDSLRRLAVGGRPEAYVHLAQALQLQERRDEALMALDLFLVPANANSGKFGAALVLRAKHRLHEEGRVVLDHDAACAEVGLALDDLQRVGRNDGAYAEAVHLQSLLADRRAQVSAGVRFKLNEQQVRHELQQKQFDRVRANLDYHGQTVGNQESDLFWLLRALTYQAMGRGDLAKALYTAEQAVDIALQQRRHNTAAEEIIRRIYAQDEQNEGFLHRALSFINGVLNWLASLLGGDAR